jgi:HPt (histidine-containing phosphotransfer) domain-containing protein
MRDGLAPRVFRRRIDADAGGRLGAPRTPARCETAAQVPGGGRCSGAARGAPDGAAEVLEYLHRLEAQGSPGLAAEVIEIFMQDTSTRVTALRRAIDQGDGETVFRVAHTLQGSASMIGAVSVARSCDALAKSARSGSFDQCKVLVAELDARFEAIQRAMPVRRLTGPEQLR